MQFTSLALLGLGALAVAAPVETSVEVAARQGTQTLYCPKDKYTGCSAPHKGKKPPKGGDVYKECSLVKQKGLFNIFICDLFHNINLDIPIIITVPITIG